MLTFIKKPVVIVLIIVIIGIIAGGYFYFIKTKKKPYETIIVKKGNVVQEVSITGRVNPAESVDLAFEKGGRVTWAKIKVGDNVYSGQTLIELYNADLIAQLNQAKADLNAQQAKLNELLRGTRKEEIHLQEVKVENAKVALEDAKKNLIDKIQDAYTKSDDAIRDKIDQLFSNPRSSNPQLNFSVVDFQLKIQIEQGRYLFEQMLAEWKASLEQLTISSDLISYTNTAKQNLDQGRSLTEKIALALNTLSSSSTLSQTTLDGWKTDVSTARTNINTAITNLTAAEEKTKTAESNLAVAEKELELKKAGATQEEIDAQKAKVDQAEAGVKNIQAQIEKTILHSPIKGVVTKQDAKVGEIVSANTIIISIISEAQFEIEANVTEADIAKVKIGDTAKITLDAYGNDVIWQAKVISIDPAETIIEGVATYRITLQFIQEDERIKPGMTANIDILTAKKENVIMISQRAIISKNGDKIVKVLDSSTEPAEVKEIKIKTGLRGSDGNIEIIEGLKEGDKVIIK